MLSHLLYLIKKSWYPSESSLQLCSLIRTINSYIKNKTQDKQQAQQTNRTLMPHIRKLKNSNNRNCLLGFAPSLPSPCFCDLLCKYISASHCRWVPFLFPVTPLVFREHIWICFSNIYFILLTSLFFKISVWIIFHEPLIRLLSLCVLWVLDLPLKWISTLNYK